MYIWGEAGGEGLSQKTQLDVLIRKGNGYLSCKDAARCFDISPQVVFLYAQEKGLTRKTRGLYQDPNSWEDHFYELQFRYPKLVFSHETALHLHGTSHVQGYNYNYFPARKTQQMQL